MEFIVENARTGAPLTADKYPCAVFATLGEVDRKNPQHPSDGGPWKEFRCNYSLGERLFLDLYRTLGREQFREGFRNLYLASKGRSRYAGIAEVEEAFKKDAAPEVVAAVNTVINRQYHGTEPYDLSHLDDGPVDPSFPSINGRIADAFISLDQEWPVEVGSRTTKVSIENLKEIEGRVYLYRRFAFPYTTDHVSILLETVEYHMDGFAYGRRFSSSISGRPVAVAGGKRRWDRPTLTIGPWAITACTRTTGSVRWRRWSTRWRRDVMPGTAYARAPEAESTRVPGRRGGPLPPWRPAWPRLRWFPPCGPTRMCRTRSRCRR